MAARNIAAVARLDTCLSTGRLTGLATARRRAIFIDARDECRRLSTSTGRLPATSQPSRATRVRSRLVHKARFAEAIRVARARRIRTGSRRERWMRLRFPERVSASPSATAALYRACPQAAQANGPGFCRDLGPDPKLSTDRTSPIRTTADANCRDEKQCRTEAPHAYPHALANDTTRNRQGDRRTWPRCESLSERRRSPPGSRARSRPGRRTRPRRSARDRSTPPARPAPRAGTRRGWPG